MDYLTYFLAGYVVVLTIRDARLSLRLSDVSEREDRLIESATKMAKKIAWLERSLTKFQERFPEKQIYENGQWYVLKDDKTS